MKNKKFVEEFKKEKLVSAYGNIDKYIDKNKGKAY
jgi:hypothetical protein